eukprot:jgi/Psemu1/19878/gm1.19878_g
MDVPNNNVDSDVDSNISQVLLSDDDRKPSSAPKDPPLVFENFPLECGEEPSSAREEKIICSQMMWREKYLLQMTPYVLESTGHKVEAYSPLVIKVQEGILLLQISDPFKHLGDTSAKKKPPNLESALFSHQNGNADFTSKTLQTTKRTNKAPNKEAPPNPCREATKALLMKKSPYTRAIKTTFLVNFKGLSLSDLHQNKHSLMLIKLQTKAINSRPNPYKKELAAFRATPQTSSRNNHSVFTFQTQTIKYLDEIEKEFDGATDQYIEQMEAVAAEARQTKQKKAKSVTSSKGDRPQDFIEYDITEGDAFLCPKCGHMIVMQLDTTEAIPTLNHEVNNDHEDKMSQLNQLAASICESQPKPTRAKVDPKELEEDTAPKTIPGLVSMIHDSIAEATSENCFSTPLLGRTCAKFLEDTTASKQDITRNACSSVFFQMASNPHLGSAKFQKTIKEAMGSIRKNTIDVKNIDQLRAKHKGKTAVPSNDTRFYQNRLMAGILGMDNSRFLTNHSRKKPPPLHQLKC